MARHVLKCRAVESTTASVPPIQQYSPVDMSSVLSDVVADAVPALLDQHGQYDLPHLSEYLKKYYPEIPEVMRAPIIVAATSAARRAASFHGVVEKNTNSKDLRKRDFAAEAASALSFWALGLRPVHRSGDVYSLATEATQSDLPTSTADPEVVQSLIDLISLPVPMQNGDREFDEMMEAYQRDMQQSEISSSISSVVSLSSDLVTAVQPAARAQPVISSTIVSAFDDPAPLSLPSAEVYILSGMQPVSLAPVTTVVSAASTCIPIVHATPMVGMQEPGGDTESTLEIHAPSDSGLDPDHVSLPSGRNCDFSSLGRRRTQKIVTRTSLADREDQ